jgi:hypothetical protein
VGDGGTMDSGASTFSCALAAAYERNITGDGGTVSADGLTVYNASQSNVITLVKTGTGPAMAYAFRSDRPGDPVQTLQLGSSTGSRLLSSARSVANNATLALAVDQNSVYLYNWPDNGSIGPPSVTGGTVNFDAVKMVPTNADIFYMEALHGGGTYVEVEPPSATPSAVAAVQVSTQDDTGISDGTRAYRLSDDSVMALYYASDMTLHQNMYPAGSTSPSANRQFFTGSILPFSFLANGPNVDVSAAIAIGDAGAFGLFTGTIPESQLSGFDPGTSLKQVMGAAISSMPCAAAFPGKLILLAPTTSGMDLIVIDVATATVSYSLTGASNILHGDNAIVTCGIGPAGVLGGVMTFEVVWAENAGGSGMQNLFYAPLQCTL